MASEAVLDLDALVRPVSGDAPAGENLREDPSPESAYYRIKDARAAARSAERQGLFGDVIGPVEAGEWRSIHGTAPEVLGQRSKDLEVTAWLIESLARTDGFAGLRDGFRLARELVERFWDDLYPLPDEDGVETKVAPLTGLNGAGAEGTLSAPIARIPITAGNSVGPLATWSCQQAVELERLDEDARQERVESGATSMEDVRTAVRETPVTFFVDLVSDLRQCLEEWAALGTALDERCGMDAPPTSAVRDALQTALDTVLYIAGDVLPVEPEVPEAGQEGLAEVGEETVTIVPQAPPGEIGSREDAFRMLAKVAEYFRRSEPHSPLSFLVERAVHWGKLPLPDLLTQLIPDESARETYEQLTGVTPHGAPDED